MKILCSTNMPFVTDAFGTLGETVVLEGRRIGAADVRDVDLLSIRSTTQVDASLLDGSAVRFVGTATIGTDHMDLSYLDRRGVRWYAAAGCNANSVSEYVTAALLCLATRHGVCLAGKTLGVIGVGHVGSLVVRKARALGMRVLLNDPPRALARESGAVSGVGAGVGEVFTGLDELLDESDAVTLHVPLTKEGPFRTVGLADERFFGRLKKGAIFLNCARGAVVKTDALLAALGNGCVSHAVIDTWEGEPRWRRDLMERVALATPHIAGHSFEGRAMGTVQVYRAACDFLGVRAGWEPVWPAPLTPEAQVRVNGRGDEAVLWDVVRQVYDIEGDDRLMRESAVLDVESRARRFDEMRKNYPMRREFRFTKVSMSGASVTLQAKVAGLGFGQAAG